MTPSSSGRPRSIRKCAASIKSIERADHAGKIFKTLMGKLVEPRREFIQVNALKAVNLDV